MKIVFDVQFVSSQTSGPCLFFVDACRNNDLPADTKAGGTGNLLVRRKGGVFVGGNFLGFRVALSSTE